MFIKHRNFEIVTKMRLKFLPILLAFFAVMAFAGAVPVLNASESAFSVEHGQSKTITLTVSNTDQAFALTNVVFNVSSSIGTFSFSPSTISSILANGTSQTSLTITIPQNQPQTTFFAIVNASGLLNSTSASNTSTLTITIPENRSLAIINIGGLATGTNTTSFKVKNTGNIQLSGSVSVSSINDGKGGQLNLTISPTTSFILNPNNNTTFNASVAIGKINVFGTHSGTITAISGTANTTASISFQETFCDFGPKGSDLRITRLKDNTLDNKDEFKWRPSNDIELEVKVENNKEDDIDAVLEYELYDPIDNTFIDLDQDEIDFSIDDRSSETVTINFRVPEDLDIDDAASRDFQLFIKVAEEGSESKQCIDSSDKFSNTAFQSVNIKKESHEVVLDDLDVPTSAVCGETVELTAKLVNIGRNDEDKVRVTLVNKELGLNLEKIFENLDETDTRAISFSVPVSKNVAEKTYKLDLVTYYNYDKGVFKDESEDAFEAFLKVQGNCQISTGNAALTASLISDANAG